MSACVWYVSTNGRWQLCSLPVAGYSQLDKSPLCKRHLADEPLAVMGNKHAD